MSDRIVETEAELNERLTEPTPQVLETLARLSGDLIVLGGSGKMGPTLARMAQRAFVAAGGRNRVIGVARSPFQDEQGLRCTGVEIIYSNLLDEHDLEALPDAENVLFLAGRKFGTKGDESGTWAVNSFLPGAICQRFRTSRIVAFSTGNVYGPVPPASRGSRENDPLDPVGEYAMSCLGRERVFEYFSRSLSIPMAMFRLNYACDLRYGILVDLAQRIWRGEAIELTTGYFNTIWQGDACAMALRAFEHVASPPWIVNVTGSELLSVRAVCNQLGRLLDKPVKFTGTEGPTALLSDARLGLERLGPARVTAHQLIEWVADWVLRGGRTLDKPTQFDSPDGAF